MKMKGLLGNLKFSKFKYKGEVYSIGENVLITDGGSECSVAKIVKILPTKGINNNNYWPTIIVEWYYRKCDLLKDADSIPNFKEDYISEYEVFESQHRDTIYIESIVGKCKVACFEEYENSNDTSGNLYFSRAKYDPVKVKFLFILDDRDTSFHKVGKNMHLQGDTESGQNLCSV